MVVNKRPLPSSAIPARTVGKWVDLLQDASLHIRAAPSANAYGSNRAQLSSLVATRLTMLIMTLDLPHGHPLRRDAVDPSPGTGRVGKNASIPDSLYACRRRRGRHAYPDREAVDPVTGRTGLSGARVSSNLSR